jgi:FkbM family methyltransferase
MNNIEYVYDQKYKIIININNYTIKTEIDNSKEKEYYINDKINLLHNQLKIKYGNFYEELPEQKMVVRYLTGNEKVLEIGSNIGRNSLIIASIINNNNFVTLESDTSIFNQLEENKQLNNFTFYTENSALSNQTLIQKNWDTKPSTILEEGYKWVNTITYEELNKKYNIEFDTLVLDCEGAFYYILKDMPEILNNITLIIMENDYYDMNHKIYIDTVLKQNNFYVDYCERGGWGYCYNNFYEVWKKQSNEN